MKVIIISKKKYLSSNIKNQLILENNILYYVYKKDQKNEKINILDVLEKLDIIKNNTLKNLPYINKMDYNKINNFIKTKAHDKKDCYFNKEVFKYEKNFEKKIIYSILNFINGNIFNEEDEIYNTMIITSGDIIFEVFNKEIGDNNIKKVNK